MRRIVTDIEPVEMVSYGLLATAAIGVVLYLFHADPVRYTYLITEDFYGEYATSVALLLSGVVLAALSFRSGPRSRKIAWGSFAIIALIMAGEEISWGQRIIGLETPSIIYKINGQGEIGLHNVATSHLVGELTKIAAYLVVAWSLFSALVSIKGQRFKETLLATGLPLIPIKLAPIFLLGPSLILFKPVAKSFELGELFLGIAVAMWTIDLFNRYGWIKWPSGLRAVGVMLGMLLFVALGSAALTHWKMDEDSIRSRLNQMAKRDYPSRHMYEQAQLLYEYIYARPQYISSDTRINHGRMLVSADKGDEAFAVFSEASKELEAANPSSAWGLRRQGVLYTLLGELEKAYVKFNEAVEVDQREAEEGSDPARKAELLWSIARTLEARGNGAMAITTAEQARETSASAKLREYIRRWMVGIRAKSYSGCLGPPCAAGDAFDQETESGTVSLEGEK